MSELQDFGTIFVGQEDRALGSCRAWIANGRWPAGARIPSERALAATLAVNRKAIRAALATLEREGLVTQRSARIRAVAEHPHDAGSLFDTVAVLTDFRIDVSPPEGMESRSGPVLGIMAAIQAAGLRPLSIAPATMDADAVRRIVAQRPRGVVMLQDIPASRTGAAVAQTLLEAGIPVAAYADVLSENALRDAPFDRVRSDQGAGASALVHHLHARGCQRLLQLWDNSVITGTLPAWRSERSRGMAEACTKLRIAEPRRAELLPLVRGDNPPDREFQRHVRMVAGFLYEHLQGDTPIDGILAISDIDTYYVAAACQLLGVSLPIVGYDDLWRGYELRERYGRPLVATVRKDMPRIGAELVTLLQQRVAANLPQDVQIRTIAPQLVICDEHNPASGARS
ncbi:MAG: GntR family transcriptional regulator [Planctomycetota bacterium]|jgi:DNA-binding LacI/PurR family transcriptional regulator|nr:GntR family transcriptional regulator [Planctomycetota bacterium]